MSDYRRYFVAGGTYFFTLVFDYIHYNPMKHGLVSWPSDWPWSTFHRWVRAGHYSIAWAAGLSGQPLPGDAGE
jgi:putative transposase